MSDTSTKTSKRGWKIFGLLVGLSLLLGTLYYFFFPRLNMKAVKEKISEFATNAENPDQSVSLEYILLQGVNEIRWRRSTWLQVKKVAQAGGISVETAIVDAAISQARDYGYIN